MEESQSQSCVLKRVLEQNRGCCTSPFYFCRDAAAVSQGTQHFPEQGGNPSTALPLGVAPSPAWGCLVAKTTSINIPETFGVFSSREADLLGKGAFLGSGGWLCSGPASAPGSSGTNYSLYLFPCLDYCILSLQWDGRKRPMWCLLWYILCLLNFLGKWKCLKLCTLTDARPQSGRSVGPLGGKGSDFLTSRWTLSKGASAVRSICTRDLCCVPQTLCQWQQWVL